VGTEKQVARPGMIPPGFQSVMQKESTEESAQVLMTVEDLEEAFPEEVEQIRKETAEKAAVEAERNRIREREETETAAKEAVRKFLQSGGNR